MKLKSFSQFTPPLILTLALLSLWQFIVATKHISNRILPSPFAIYSDFSAYWQVILANTTQTLIETLIGLAIATILGVGMAIILDNYLWLRKALYPLLITSQTIPMIALAPLLLLWFGFDLTPKVIIVVLSCFFPITIATVDGLFIADKDLLKLFKSMNASRWQIMKFVKLPGALPQFFSGLKIAATYAVGSAVVGEYVGAYQGLGIYMQEMAHAYATTLVFAGIAITAILSLLLFGIVALLEKMCIRWK